MKKYEILKEIENLKNIGNLRSLKPPFPKEIVNLSSNDYLGLGNDEILKKEFLDKYKDDFSFSSSSSRLLTGNYKALIDLEAKLDEIYKKSSLVVNSGYSANTLIIKTFFNKKSLIISDRLNHASIYDGIIGSGAKLVRYNHLDMNHLESILIKYKDEYDDILIISETIYSMDGDCVDLEDIVNLKRKYMFSLMIDEAHSYGVHGYGIAYEKDLLEDIDFLTIPLGKGGSSMGSYIIMDEIYKAYLINKGRELIYTTALPPINNLWNLFILNKMNEFYEKKNKLEEIKNFTLHKIKDLGLKTMSSTHIIGLIVGGNKKADIISENLRAKGYGVYPIKSPTVTKGSERIRLSLTSDITKEIIIKFLEEFKYEYNSFF